MCVKFVSQSQAQDQDQDRQIAKVWISLQFTEGIYFSKYICLLFSKRRQDWFQTWNPRKKIYFTNTDYPIPQLFTLTVSVTKIQMNTRSSDWLCLGHCEITVIPPYKEEITVISPYKELRLAVSWPLWDHSHLTLQGAGCLVKPRGLRTDPWTFLVCLALVVWSHGRVPCNMFQKYVKTIGLLQ